MVEDSPQHQTPAPGTPGSPGHPGSPGPSESRCVVLTGPNGSAPADLLSGLSTRGVSTIVVNHPASAMVELAREAAGILVVVEPTRHPYLQELITAVKRYHPLTVRWGYTAAVSSGLPQLQALTKDASDTPGPFHVNEQDGSACQPDPQGKYLVPDPKSPLGRAQAQVPRERVRSLVVKVRETSEADEPLISEEELAMLLGPTPDDSGETP